MIDHYEYDREKEEVVDSYRFPMSNVELLSVINTLKSFITGEGYVRCDTAACNCGSYHARGGFYARFMEIEEVIEPRNGETLLTAVKRVKESYFEEVKHNDE